MGDDDPAKTGEAHAKAITTYCEAIRAAGGEPVFYEMGWARSEREAEDRKRHESMPRSPTSRSSIPNTAHTPVMRGAF